MVVLSVMQQVFLPWMGQRFVSRTSRKVQYISNFSLAKNVLKTATGCHSITADYEK